MPVLAKNTHLVATMPRWRAEELAAFVATITRWRAGRKNSRHDKPGGARGLPVLAKNTHLVATMPWWRAEELCRLCRHDNPMTRG